MLASSFIIALYVAVPVTLVAAALLRSEMFLRKEGVALRVSSSSRFRNGALVRAKQRRS